MSFVWLFVWLFLGIYLTYHFIGIFLFIIDFVRAELQPFYRLTKFGKWIFVWFYPIIVFNWLLITFGKYYPSFSYFNPMEKND